MDSTSKLKMEISGSRMKKEIKGKKVKGTHAVSEA